MAEVAIEIGGRSYSVHCRDGEEAQLHIVARMIDQRVNKVRQSAPGINETRMLLYASLLLADELHDAANGRNAAPVPPPPPMAEPAPPPALPPAMDAADIDATNRALETLAERLESAAERLAALADAS